MNIDWATVLAWVNSVIAGIIVVTRLRLIVRNNPDEWIHVGFVFIGLYWCGLYAFVAIVPAGYIDPILFGQVFVRPAFTVTLVWIASSGLYRSKLTLRQIQDDINLLISKIKLLGTKFIRKIPNKIKKKVG